MDRMRLWGWLMVCAAVPSCAPARLKANLSATATVSQDVAPSASAAVSPDAGGPLDAAAPPASLPPTVAATGSYHGAPGFDHGMASTTYCGSHPESWVRASATLDRAAGQMSIAMQLETDSTLAGPKGRSSVTMLDDHGMRLAVVATNEVGMGGKPPGRAVAKDFTRQLAVPRAIADRTATMQVATECTGASIGLWGLVGNEIRSANLAAQIETVSSTEIRVSRNDAAVLTGGTPPNPNAPQLATFARSLQEAATRASGTSEGGKVQLYQIRGEEFDELPAIGALMLGSQPSCTATVISPLRALTAAHCVYGVDKQNLTFIVGVNAVASNESYGISDITIHAGYRPDDFNSPDLALVVLDRPFSGAPIAIAQHDMTNELRSSPIAMIGYGFAGRSAAGVWYGLGVKRRINVKVGAIRDATIRYNPFNGKTACIGDSGGPALYVDPNSGDVTILGITSYGTSQCNSYVQDVRIDYRWATAGSAEEYAAFIAGEKEKG